MSPEEARDYLTQLDFYEPDEEVVEDALETVAGLEYEYAVEVCRGGEWVLAEDSYWGPFSVASVRYVRTMERSRLVRRLVGKREVA